MKTYWGLDNLREVYCPKCGNYLDVVANGFFHGQLFYCPKEKKIFNIIIKDITKMAGKDYLDQCELDTRIRKVKTKITSDNIKKIEELVSPYYFRGSMV